ncbi:MAG: hypothetical protein CM1200mP12_11510 [Gammaproteobacteria bacterium]|nr:MAG: hypothetical protein CM1200mP12_11510 [Gammaproteobacteria bacterium]
MLTIFSVPIIYVNQVGGQDELVFDGSSLVVSPGSGIDLQLPSFKTENCYSRFCQQRWGFFQLKNKKKVVESLEAKNLYLCHCFRHQGLYRKEWIYWGLDWLVGGY